jgi:hypothetical protein
MFFFFLNQPVTSYVFLKRWDSRCHTSFYDLADFPIQLHITQPSNVRSYSRQLGRTADRRKILQKRSLFRVTVDSRAPLAPCLKYSSF